MRQTVYLVRKGNEYLTALAGADGETDIEKMTPRFSIYRYDAVQLPKVGIANQIIKALMNRAGGEWHIERYNKCTYYAEVIV